MIDLVKPPKDLKLGVLLQMFTMTCSAIEKKNLFPIMEVRTGDKATKGWRYRRFLPVIFAYL